MDKRVIVERDFLTEGEMRELLDITSAQLSYLRSKGMPHIKLSMQKRIYPAKLFGETVEVKRG